MSVVALAPVQTADLPEYPYGADDRLDSHHFVPWERRRWLNSEMRLKGSLAARALYLDLIWISYEQSPIGTLPRDAEQLAKLAMVDLTEFEAMAAQPYGPLHKWQPCVVDSGDVRLFHLQVLRTLGDAFARREDNRARNDAANRAKRLQRLREALATYSADLVKQDAAVTWIDQWLTDQGCTYRNAQWIERGLTAWQGHMADLHHGRRPP